MIQERHIDEFELDMFEQDDGEQYEHDDEEQYENGDEENYWTMIEGLNRFIFSIPDQTQ